MIWSSWSEFFAMGGYGVYVWGSYFVALVCIVGEVILISRRRRTLVKTYGLIHDSNAEEISNNEASLEIEKKPEVERTNEISDLKSSSNKEEIKNETTS